MTELVVALGRRRRTYTNVFKQELVDLCVQPGMSLASVARQHDLHPTLLARWVKERTAPAKLEAPRPISFVPVHVNAPRCVEQSPLSQPTNRVELSIHRGELRIDVTLQQAGLVEIGHMLREVLR